MKAKSKKSEFEDGISPGSKRFISQKSEYITSTIFLDWFNTHFIPRKLGIRLAAILLKCYAEEKAIVLLSMPSHTSHYLQPFNRAVFKLLKTDFSEQYRL